MPDLLPAFLSGVFLLSICLIVTIINSCLISRCKNPKLIAFGYKLFKVGLMGGIFNVIYVFLTPSILNTLLIELINEGNKFSHFGLLFELIFINLFLGYGCIGFIFILCGCLYQFWFLLKLKSPCENIKK